MTNQRAFVVPLLALAVTCADFLGLLPGWWWLTGIVAGVACALVAGGRALVTVLAASVLAWSAMLLWQSDGHVAGVADVVGAIALGGPGFAWFPLAATALLCLATAVIGAWLGAAARRLRGAIVTETPE